MSTIGDRSFTNFQNVNLKGNSKTGSTDPGIVRVEGGGFAGTASVNTTYFDQNIAWTLPAKSGTLPISGTFSVDLPIVAATTYAYSTIVTVTGVLVEDGVTCTMGSVASTGQILVGAKPTAANSITLYFVNIGSATTSDTKTYTVGYTLVR